MREHHQARSFDIEQARDLQLLREAGSYAMADFLRLDLEERGWRVGSTNDLLDEGVYESWLGRTLTERAIVPGEDGSTIMERTFKLVPR